MTAEAKIEEKIVVALQPPKLWKVVFHNDDQTPMEFVIELLTSVFKTQAVLWQAFTHMRLQKPKASNLLSLLDLMDFHYRSHWKKSDLL